MLSVVLAGYSGVDSSILYLSCEGTDRQKAFGLYSSMSMAGLLIAAAVFLAFVGDDYRLAGLLTVISYGLAMVLTFGLTEVRQSNAAEPAAEPFRESLRQIVSNRTLLLFLVGAALLSETHQTITVFLNQLQYERCGVSSSVIGLVYIAATLLGLLGAYSSAFTRRLGIRRSFALFCGLAAVSCLTLGSVPYALPSVVSVLLLRLSNTLFQPLLEDTMKKILSLGLACVMLAGLTACGSSSVAASSSAAQETTLTGQGQGFGGVITATITMNGDTITAVAFDGPNETEAIGGGALEELAAQVVAANGAEIDAVSGATIDEGCTYLDMMKTLYDRIQAGDYTEEN